MADEDFIGTNKLYPAPNKKKSEAAFVIGEPTGTFPKEAPGKWAIKVRDKDHWVAIQRFPTHGFTTCSKKGNPGVYDVWVFETREEARQILNLIPEPNNEEPVPREEATT